MNQLYNVFDGFIHDDKRECRLVGRDRFLKAGGGARRRGCGVNTFRENRNATELPIRHNLTSGEDLTELGCKRTRCFVTGMFERCRLNLTNKADLVANMDQPTNVVRETHTLDAGCVEVLIKENKT